MGYEAGSWNSCTVSQLGPDSLRNRRMLKGEIGREGGTFQDQIGEDAAHYWRELKPVGGEARGVERFPGT